MNINCKETKSDYVATLEEARLLRDAMCKRQVVEARPRIPAVNPRGFLCVNILVQKIVKKVLVKARHRHQALNWGKANRLRKNVTNAQYTARHKEKVKKMISSWMAKNRERLREWENKRNAERRKTDPTFVVKRRCRSRLIGYRNGKGAGKADLTFNQIGLSPEEFTEYLNAQLATSETLIKMRLDHIFPMDAYDVCNMEMQRRMMHYTNFQPLLEQENCNKSNKLPTKAMAAKVARWAWPDGITEDMLPDKYDGWATPLRMESA